MPMKWILRRIEKFYRPFQVPFDYAEYYSILHDLAEKGYIKVLGDMVMKTCYGDDEMDEMIDELVRRATTADDMFILSRVFDMHNNGEITIRSINAKIAHERSLPYIPQFTKKNKNLFNESSHA